MKECFVRCDRRHISSWVQSRSGEREGVGGGGARGYIVLYKGYLSTPYGIIYICSIFLVPTKFYDVTIIQHKHQRRSCLVYDPKMSRATDMPVSRLLQKTTA